MSLANLQIRVEWPDRPVLILQGEVDFRTAPQIREAIRELVDAGHRQIWVDASAVDFIDSSGISALFDSTKMLEPLGGRLHLRSPSEQLLHVLQVVGFAAHFDLDAEEAPLAECDPIPIVSRQWQATRFRVPCHLDLVARIRDRVAEIARFMPFTSQEVDDLKLAIGEAASNAFRHGCRNKEDDTIVVHCVADGQTLTIEITDPGPGFDYDDLRPPVIEEIRDGGMGIHFMKLLMDAVEFRLGAEGFTVRMVKRAKSPGWENPG